MIDLTPLHDIILLNISELKKTPSGWYTCKCPICNDYKVRGGFRLEIDAIGYHCFNCGFSTKYDPTTGIFPSKLEQVLEKFGIERTDYQQILFDIKKQLHVTGNISTQAVQRFQFNVEPIYFPKCFVKLSDYKGPNKDKYVDYLTKRSLAHLIGSRYFYVVDESKIETNEDKELAIKHRNSIILPVWLRNDVVWYTSRRLVNAKPKYLSCSVPKKCIISNMDVIHYAKSQYIFICEGPFDALSVKNGTAIYSNNMTKQQIELLNKCRAMKVYIPDKGKEGLQGALQALEQGWYVSTPDIGNCKDLNEALVKYGSIYLHKTIYDNIQKGDKGKIAVHAYCKLNWEK
jgi:hypothetical protein